MISACCNMMKHVAESIKTLAGQLNRFDEVRESDQLRRTVIEFSGTNPSVSMAQKSNGHVCISLNPALLVLKRLKQLDYRTNYAENFDRDVHRDRSTQAIETSVRSHLCQPSLLIVPMLPYPLSDISSIKNSYTDNRDAEHDSERYLMQLLMRCGAVSGGLCFWGCWPMHRCWGLNVLPHAYWECNWFGRI